MRASLLEHLLFVPDTRPARTHGATRRAASAWTRARVWGLWMLGFASMSPDQPRIGRLVERALGIFRIGTGLWFTYRTFAAALNFILNYNLPL